MASRPFRASGIRSAWWILLAVTAACDGRSGGVAASVPAAAVVAESITAPTPAPSTDRIDDAVPTTGRAATPVATSGSTTSPTSTTGATGTTSARGTTSTTSTTSTTLRAPMTSCTRVAHIGDSTGVYLWDPEYVGGDPANTIEARYRSVGVDSIVHDDVGGRAIVERLTVGSENAVEVARRMRASGFRGCWVIMVGTNDAANLAAGAAIDAGERIGRVLAVIDGDPVLWVDAATVRADTHYRSEAMAAWNTALAQLDAELEHLAVAAWSARAQPAWFQPDGIHLTPEGRVWRAAIVALELAAAFPAS